MTKDVEDNKPSGARGGGPGDPTALDRGAVVGRYVILHRAGIGGMGVVYAAYDPELDRKIAIKLVHPKRGGTPARARLLREAQAMARLSHPNVIAVHDVGTFGDGVFLALEYVEGETLARWLTRERPPWRRTLQVFREAGRGLAAAHRAGLVHRDFKPSNVLLGDDGRTRVLDFGMARPRAEGRSSESAESPEPVEGEGPRKDLPPSPLSTPVTEEGVVIGTLPYMAPEVPRNRGTDARSDQFSFCAALYEALYGEHPFASPGESTLDLIDRMVKGEVRPAPPGSPVPGWLRNVLRRGLSTEPEARYPSMDRLLSALDEGPRVQRRMVLVAAVAMFVLVAGWLLVGAGEDPPEMPAACREGEEEIAEIWNEEARQRIEAAFAATGSVVAEDSWQHAREDLARFVSAWRGQLRDACDDTHVRGDQSDEVLELRLLCLDRRMTQLSALLDVFSQADEQVAEESVAAVRNLDAPEHCSDMERVLASPRPEPDPQKRLALRQARARLARAQALAAAGKYREALEEGQATAAAAKSLSHPDLLAEALVLTGEMHRWLGNHGPAADDLVETMWASEASRQDRLAAQAANQLVWLLGVDQRLFARAHYWVRLGRAKLDRALGDVRGLRADLLDGEGVLLRIEGRYAESLDRHREALALRQEQREEQGDGASELKIAATSDYLAATVGSMGRHGEAREHLERALEIRRRVLGPDHPYVANDLLELAVSLLALERVNEALPLLERALEIYGTVDGDPSELANVRFELARALERAGRDATRARKLARQARDFYREDEERFGEELEEVTSWLTDRG